MVVLFLATVLVMVLIVMIIMFFAVLVMVRIMMVVMLQHSIFPEGQNAGLRQCHQRHTSAIAG